MRTVAISSSLTLFLKYVLPFGFLAFWTPFLISIFMNTGSGFIGFLPSWVVKLLFLSFVLSVFGLFYFTLMRLMRVETDGEYVYVSNYFKVVRYPLSDIKAIHDRSFLLFTIKSIELKSAGYFGKYIRFWASDRFREVVEAAPSIKQLTENS